MSVRKEQTTIFEVTMHQWEHPKLVITCSQWTQVGNFMQTNLELQDRENKPNRMSSRIPPLLEPYLVLPPEASLILLTSVLGASTNWLVLRFLHSALAGLEISSDLSSEDESKVLLVSFMRDLAFWKENARRLVGANFLWISWVSRLSLLNVILRDFIGPWSW